MNYNPRDREENSAYIQLLILGCYVLAGMIAGGILGFAGMYLLYGADRLTDPAGLPAGGLKIAQIVSSICVFLLPPLLLAIHQRGKIKGFYGFKKPKSSILLIVLLIMVCSMPMMEWIGLANQHMVLPEFMKSVQDWMRAKEDELMKMTILLLTVNNGWDFIINLFMIALLPAVGEELLFRGGLQRSFGRMFNNPHMAIWLSAIIFSAIHMQFFGFFPRVILGAGFGYIYLYTGSLWYAMFAHFLNNAYACFVALYLQLHHMPLSEADNSSNFQWYGYLISLILTILLFIYLKRKTNGKQLD